MGNFKKLQKLKSIFKHFNFTTMKKIVLSVFVHIAVSYILVSAEHHLSPASVWVESTAVS